MPDDDKVDMFAMLWKKKTGPSTEAKISSKPIEAPVKFEPSIQNQSIKLKPSIERQPLEKSTSSNQSAQSESFFLKREKPKVHAYPEPVKEKEPELKSTYTSVSNISPSVTKSTPSVDVQPKPKTQPLPAKSSESSPIDDSVDFMDTSSYDYKKLRDQVLEDLIEENEQFEEQNKELKREIENQVALMTHLKNTFDRVTFEKQVLEKDKERLVSERESLKNEKTKLEDELWQLKEERTEVVNKFQRLEVDIMDYKGKTLELEDQLSEIDVLKKALKESRIELMKAELETDNYRKENETLLFQVGSLEQQLTLKKLGLVSEENLNDPEYFKEKSNRTVLELTSQIKKLEDAVRLKDIEYKARLQIYQKAIGKKDILETLGNIEDLRLQLQAKNDEIKAKDILLQEFKSKIGTGKTITGLAQSGEELSDLSKRIVTLEKFLSDRDAELHAKIIQITELKDQLADSIEKISNYEADIIELSSKTSDSELNTELLNDLMLKVNKMRIPESELEQRVNEYSLQITKLARENDLLQAQIVDLYKKLAQLDTVFEESDS